MTPSREELDAAVLEKIRERHDQGNSFVTVRWLTSKLEDLDTNHQAIAHAVKRLAGRGHVENWNEERSTSRAWKITLEDFDAAIETLEKVDAFGTDRDAAEQEVAR